jgi:3-dehydrosphinganine reductase
VTHVLVTGGSSGIGKALARLHAARGDDVTLIARDVERLGRAAAEIGASAGAPGMVQALAADVSDAAALTAAVRRAERAAGPVHTLIASAGICRPGRFVDLEPEVHRRTMEVNYFGCLHAVHAVLPAMRARAAGRIALISSGAGLIGFDGYTPYAPTKFALRGLAECLRGELRPLGIGVSIVYPPDTDTKPEETRRITGMARTWSADAVARTIVRGMDRGRFEIAPGWEMRVLARLHSALSPFLRWRFDRITAAVRLEERRRAAVLVATETRP